MAACHVCGTPLTHGAIGMRWCPKCETFRSYGSRPFHAAKMGFITVAQAQKADDPGVGPEAV